MPYKNPTLCPQCKQIKLMAKTQKVCADCHEVVIKENQKAWFENQKTIKLKKLNQRKPR